MSQEEKRQLRFLKRVGKHRVPKESLPVDYEVNEHDQVVCRLCKGRCGQCGESLRYSYFNGFLPENHFYYKKMQGYRQQ